jgi:hypothetical protein
MAETMRAHDYTEEQKTEIAKKIVQESLRQAKAAK